MSTGKEVGKNSGEVIMADRVVIYRDNATGNNGTCKTCHTKGVERLYFTLLGYIISEVCIECFKSMVPDKEADYVRNL